MEKLKHCCLNIANYMLSSLLFLGSKAYGDERFHKRCFFRQTDGQVSRSGAALQPSSGVSSHFQTNGEHMAGFITCNVAIRQRPHEAPVCGRVHPPLQLWANTHLSGLYTHTHRPTMCSGEEGAPPMD